MIADWDGIQRIRTQPEMIEKVKRWREVINTTPKELYYYNRICPMTGEHRPPIELPPNERCYICKEIWPDIVKNDFSCPCHSIEMSVKEIFYVVELLLRK